MSKTERGRAAVLSGRGGEFTVESYEVPRPDAGQLLAKVELTGICGTDVHIYHGHLPSVQFPLILGHEITGTVVELGSGVTQDYLGRPVKAGDRVAFSPGASCGTCHTCVVLKAPWKCQSKPPSYGFKAPADTAPHFFGGYAEYLHAFNRNTIFFKTDLPAEIAVLLEPLAIGVHGVERARVGLGDTVVVQGTGIIGLGAILCARLAGASRVVAVGGPPARLDLARRLGADEVIDIAQVPEPAERARLVREYVGSPLGASVVIECAGVPAAFLEAIDYVADGGVVSEVGHFTDNGAVTFNPWGHLLRRNITIEGVFSSGGVDKFCKSLAILERGGYPFDEIVSHQIPLSRLGEAFTALSTDYRLDGRDAVKIAVNPWL